MSEKIEHAAPVPPFVRFVASAVPMVFDNSLSYYEALCALWKWLQDDVIDVINNNATVTEQYIELDEETRQLFIELKSYVDNYFDNLDVQEEINNKLDAMVEAGTLQEIIDAYLDSNITWVFDTVADMKAATNLIDGSDARTLGFYAVNDGGGATYHIVNTGTANEMDVIAVNSLYAVLQADESNIKQFGAHGDGTSNDSNYFVRALDYAMDHDYTVKVPTGTYLLNPNVFQAVTKTGTYNNLSIEGVGKTQSVLKLNNSSSDQYFSNSTSRELYAELNFRNLGFTGNDHTANGFYCYSTGTEKRFRFYNCHFELANVLYCDGSGNADLHRFENCSGDIYGAFITLNNAQSVETEVYGTSLGFYANGKFLKHYDGGVINIFGGEFEAFGGVTDYLLDFADQATSMGIGNAGINFTGSRFELHNGHKFINTNGKVMKASFTNCNIGTADTLSSGTYYSTLLQYSDVLFTNCIISDHLTFNVNPTVANVGLGALLRFVNCSSRARIYSLITAQNTHARVISTGESSLIEGLTRGASDFDLNFNERSGAPVAALTKTAAIKRDSDGYPQASTTGSISFTMPPKSFVKRIKCYRPALSAGSATYQLHIGNSDKSVIYAETSASATISDEITLEAKDIGFLEDNVILVWATGTATNITDRGYIIVEYI